MTPRPPPRRPDPAPVPLARSDGPVRAGGPEPLEPGLLARLRDVCAEVDTSGEATGDGVRDWWPLGLSWAAAGSVPARAAAVARPADAGQVAAVLAACDQARVAVTPAAGRSGVCGGALPAFGGVVLDLCGLSGIDDVDDASLVVRVAAGTFGDTFEDELRAAHGLTAGHWPQSMALSTVGGWLACRSAGQYSTRYGKIEDIVVGLDAVLADGTRVRTGGLAPRAASGPDLTQLLVGSEGTLAVITSAMLRVHPAPAAERRAAWAFDDFAAGLEACRRILRRGATPAVLRLYDAAESARSFDVADRAVLVVLDEADPILVDATMAVVAEECAGGGGGAGGAGGGAGGAGGGATELDPALVDRWMQHRNDVSALGALISRGFVVDTVEVAARWSRLPGLYDRVVATLGGLEDTLAASAHQSHAYTDGACLYFTFAGRPPDGADPGWAERYYTRAWDTVMAATIDAGAAISHHHGIGLNRARHMRPALGSGFGILAAVKAALDPHGILNPGKLGLDSPFGEAPWP